MFQSLKELRSAPGRTALITVTVAMITVMVAFLASLAAGLGNQSVSALDRILGDDDAVIVQDGASSSLVASRLSESTVEEVQQAVQQAAGTASGNDEDVVRTLEIANGRVGDQPVVLLPDPQLSNEQVIAASSLGLHTGPADLSGYQVRVVGQEKDLYLDHQPVVLASPEWVGHANRSGAISAIVVDESKVAAPDVPGTTVLRGDDRYELSASYKGEQLSLNSMIYLLYVISALVVGAFFTVWTVQRMRPVAISAALGASRKVLLADALGQALVVLALGIGSGIAIVAAAGSWLDAQNSIPVVVDASTLGIPAALLAITGVIGAGLSLIPILRVQPRTALTNAA